MVVHSPLQQYDRSPSASLLRKQSRGEGKAKKEVAAMSDDKDEEDKEILEALIVEDQPDVCNKK